MKKEGGRRGKKVEAGRNSKQEEYQRSVERRTKTEVAKKLNQRTLTIRTRTRRQPRIVPQILYMLREQDIRMAEPAAFGAFPVFDVVPDAGRGFHCAKTRVNEGERRWG